MFRSPPRVGTGECKLAVVHGGALKPLTADRLPCNTARGLGPRGALQKLVGQTSAQKATWLEEARIAAILGSCLLSMKSVKSGIRCYIAFVGERCRFDCAAHVTACVLAADQIAPGTRHYFPPKLETLLTWSTLFRSEGTLSNYLGYLRTACLICKAPTTVCVPLFLHKELRRYMCSRCRCLTTQR